MAVYIAIPSKEEDPVDTYKATESATPLEYDLYPQIVRRRFVLRFWPWLLHLFVFLLSISTGFLVQRASSCSPIKDELLGEHPWDITVRFDGSLSRDSSPFKGPPSKEVDKVWDDIIPPRMLIISEDVFQTINTSMHAVKAPSNLGNGRLAAFEGFHYMHCLRNLWKTHYPEYYTEEAEFARENRDEWLEHVDHCVDMLRQKLMCDADPGLITYSWLKNHYNPHPNFNVEHKCRSYSRLLDATVRHGVDLERLPEEGIRRPEGEKVVDFVEPPFDPLAES